MCYLNRASLHAITRSHYDAQMRGRDCAALATFCDSNAMGEGTASRFVIHGALEEMLGENSYI